jgi:protein phosphatase
MNYHLNNLSDIVHMAKDSSSEEFLELVIKTTNTLRLENGTLGNLKVKGKLIEVPAQGEAIIIGDLHGDLESLAYVLNDSRFLDKIKNNNKVFLIFLGDYGDRGIKSPEVYYVVMKLKLLFPNKVILMRGNHEGPHDLCVSPHDLFIHLESKFKKDGSEIYFQIRKLFDQLYTGVLIKNRFILFHGGVPSMATSIEDIAFAHKNHPKKIHLEEILWNDPCETIKGTIASPRGAGKLFGPDITKKILKILNTKLLIRSHQSFFEGYKQFHDNKILTIFSRKGPPYNNKFGTYLDIDLSENVELSNRALKEIRRY